MAKRERRLDQLAVEYREALEKRRGDIQGELADIDARLRTLRAAAPARRRAPVRRQRGGKPLRAYLEEALQKKGGTMSPKELEAAVLDLGYETKSKTLYTQIAAALRRSTDIRKVGKGEYALEASAPPRKRRTKKASAKRPRKSAPETKKAG